MLRDLLSGITSKTALLSVLLVSNAFVWYYYAGYIIQEISTAAELNYLASSQVWVAHFATLIVSAFIGASLMNKIGNRTRFLSIWMALGIVSPLIVFAINTTDLTSITLLSLIFGLSLGIGMPNCMGYFTSHATVETRGRLGGIMMFFTGVSVIALQAMVPNNVVAQVFVLVAWRGFGLLSLFLLKPRETITQKEKTPSYKTVLSARPFILYFVPWVMFSLVNYLTTPVADVLFEESFINTLLIIENGLIGVFAIIGGFLIDTIGRKRMAIVGFVALGLGYAFLGVSPESYLSWYFHTLVDGIAWGILLVIFVVTVWGDLSYNAPSDKRYAMGVFPFFISGLLPLVVANQIVEAVSPTAIFSFTAFFLFLAVLPLVYAPETLPEKTMRARELKSYTEKALKKAQKEAEKSQKPHSDKAEKSKEALEESPEDAEARKLAEKYY